MPNHITTIVKAEPHVLQWLIDGTEVTFEKLVPSPPNKETGNCSHAGRTPTDGTVCWYEWNSKNWGTKWDAYSPDLSGLNSGELRFDTAWAHPYEVLAALGVRFSDERIVVRYADEDLGHNLAHYVIENGVGTVLYPRPGEVAQYTEEDMEFACQVKYGKSYDEMKAEWYGEG